MAVAFVDGSVIIGDGRILEHATVLVEDEKIVRVAQRGITLPRNVHKISLDGMTLLPGFIDAHVHICLDGSPDPITTMLNGDRSINRAKIGIVVNTHIVNTRSRLRCL